MADLTKVFLDLEGLGLFTDYEHEYVQGLIGEETDRATTAEMAIVNSLAQLESQLNNQFTEVDSKISENASAIASISQTVDTHNSDIEALKHLLAEQNIIEISEQVTANKEAIELLNSDVNTDGSIAHQVNAAISGIIDGADETMDTLRELAEFIKKDGADITQILTDLSGIQSAVEQNTSNIDEISTELENLSAGIERVSSEVSVTADDCKKYADKQDKYYYELISSIEDTSIINLFKIKVSLGERNISDAINELSENEMLVLNEDSVITEDLNIDKNVVIDAAGSVFTGTVTVKSDADIVISNATFEKPIVMA